MSREVSSSRAVLEQASNADELALRLAAAAWQQAATATGDFGVSIEAATWAIRRARRDCPTINRAAGAVSLAAELAVESAAEVLDLPDRLVLSAIEAARWAAMAAAVRPWVGGSPRSLLKHPLLDAVAAPWLQAICVRGRLATGGPDVEQLAGALLVDGWALPIGELPAVVAALLAR